MKTPYTVGYGKPPKDTQFKKGKSGNPLGRRKKRMLDNGAKEPLSFQKALIDELKSPIRITESGGRKKKDNDVGSSGKIARSPCTPR